jgi:protein-tyrosine-phosphatase
VTEEMVNAADAVYVMTFKDDLPDYVLNSPKTVYWDINDPYDMPIEQVREIQQQVKNHVKSIIS